MRIEVLDTATDVAATAAGIVVEAVEKAPETVIGWPTGRTPLPFYDELARLHAASLVDFSRTRGFNLDELMLSPEDPHSFAAFMRRHAWERIGLDRERCDIPRGNADSPAEECRRYDAAIEAAGGLDLAVLGVGVDGHVAYNLPGPPVAGTHVVEVPDEVARSFGLGDGSMPLRAFTMGMQTLATAGKVLVIATGEHKRRAITALIQGPEDPAWPCSLLRGHQDLTLVLDRAASPEGGAQ